MSIFVRFMTNTLLTVVLVRYLQQTLEGNIPISKNAGFCNTLNETKIRNLHLKAKRRASPPLSYAESLPPSPPPTTDCISETLLPRGTSDCPERELEK